MSSSVLFDAQGPRAKTVSAVGNVVAAVVVVRGELTGPALRTFLLDRLAAHELPARLLFRPSLPRNEGGKILKRELRLLLDDEALR